MKKVRKLLFVLLLCMWATRGFSFNALHIEPADSAAVPVTVSMGDSFAFDVIIRNDSSSVFSGSIQFQYKVDTTTWSGSDSVSGFAYNSANFFTINPHDTVRLTLIAHVTSPVFKTGPSVVVIWPIATNTFPVNNYTFNINVLSTGITETEEQRIKLFAWNHALYLSKQPEIPVWRVRILDITGKLVLDVPNPDGTIPLPEMNTGIYLAEVSYGVGRTRVIKFYF